MMEQANLQLFFLQNPVTAVDASGKRIQLEPKTKAVLCYLVAQTGPISRETLQTVFWPNHSSSNLYRELSRIKKQLPFLFAKKEKDAISIRSNGNLYLDVDKVNQAAVTDDEKLWEQACVLYQAKFMVEYDTKEISRDFSDWLWHKQKELEHYAQKVFINLINHSMWHGEFEYALTLANKFLQLHPVNQEVLQIKLRLLAGLEHYSEAITAYAHWANAYEHAFSLEPDEKAKEIYDQLLDLRNFSRHNIPSQLTPFIGREQELQRLTSKISDPNCRIISLFGPGGIGKTRLAMRLARQINPCFLHGTCFVPLDSINEAHLIESIAQALGIALVGKIPFLEKIIHVLASRELLLIFDSVEKLEQVGVIVNQLLMGVPGAKILITSRRRLHIYGEHIFEVDGFAQPATQTENPLQSEAVQFFLATAQRVKPDFQIDSSNGSDVIHIIQLLGGIPLAIELSASKVYLYPCAEILSKLRTGLDFLEHPGSGYSQRHLSIRATFDYSWTLLSTAEKNTLAALSVFVSGFTRQAAIAVAETTLKILNGLVNQCLIKQVDEERYNFHPLIHQFAAEKLSADSKIYEKVHMKHSQYFAAWLGNRMAIVGESNLVKYWREIARENSNIQKAWQQTIEDRNLENLDKLKHFWGYFELQALYRAGYDAFVLPARWQNIAGLEAATSQILTRRAWFCFRLGLFSEGKELAALSWSLSGESAEKSFTTDHVMTLFTLGMNHWYLGEFERADGCFQKIYKQIRNHLNPMVVTISTAYAYHGLTFVAMSKGEYDIASKYLKEVLGFKNLDLRARAQYKTVLAQVSCYLEKYERVVALLTESRAFFQEMNDLFMIAYNDCSWGIYYRSQEDYDLAEEHLEAAVSGSRSIGDPWLEMLATLLLADVLFQKGERVNANSVLQNILKNAHQMESRPQIIDAIVQTCRNNLNRNENQALIANALIYASQHPAANFESISMANSLLSPQRVSPEARLFSVNDEPKTVAEALLLLFD